MIGSVIMATLIGAMFFSVVPLSISVAWFSGIVFVGLNSWVIIRRYRANDVSAPDLGAVRLWHALNLYLSVIWGIFWALTPFFFFPDASPIEILSLLLIVVVMSSMPSITMGCYPDIYITFLTPVFFSFSWHLLSVDFGGEALPLIIAPLTWVMLVIFSILIHKTHMESIILRLEYRNAQKQADERTNAKTRFIAVASHDLRQPVQAARLYAEAMLSDGKSSAFGTTEKLTQSLALASQLLDRLLDISKLDAGFLDVNRSPISLHRVLNEVAAVHSVQASQKGLYLRVQGESYWVNADSSILVQILDNIISNAVRYTERGGITINVERLNDDIAVSIEDSGVGIPKEKHSVVFEEFVQLDSVSMGGDDPTGMGLGLSIVRRLCELHHIPFDFESDTEIGTSFRLFLPLTDVSPPSQSEIYPSRESNNLRIMLIDDEVQITDALSMILVSEGHDVEVANDFQQLKELLFAESFSPQLVLVDDRLPGNYTSEDVISEIHSHFKKTIPVIIMTGNTSPEKIKALKSSGFCILFKPVSKNQILAAISDLGID